MPLNRNSLTEQESGRTRRLTIRLPLDTVQYIVKVSQTCNGNVSKAVDKIVRAVMTQEGRI